MKLFVTHMPGFTPDTWPVVSFCDQGSVKRLKSNVDSQDGKALILYVGSGSSKDPKQRGRLLGLVDTFEQPIVPTQQMISGEHLDEPNFSSYFNDKQKFRWPCGLVIKRAWKFNQPPDARELIGEQKPDGRWLYRSIFERSAAYELPDIEQTQVVMELPKTEINIAAHEIVKELRRNTNLIRSISSKQTTGPTPSFSIGDGPKGQGSEPSEVAYCYVIRFDDIDCWKVGWTTDMGRRIKEINAHIPTEVIGNLLWSPFKNQRWVGETCRLQAYKMEQTILAYLSARRTFGERFCCTPQEVIDAMRAAKAQIAP